MNRIGPKIWLTRSGRSPFWVIRYQDPETDRTLQKSTGTDKKKEAERVLGEFRADFLNGRCHAREIVSWEVFREKYEAEVVSGLAKKTGNKIDTVLDAVERVLRPKHLADLTATRISFFIAELRNGERAESTVASYLGHLRAALSWAVGIGLLHAVPKIKKPKRAKLYKKPKGRAPTEDEFRMILETVPVVVGPACAASWQHLIEGLWFSGLRLGEAMELWWDRSDRLCIDLTEGRPLIRIPAELEKGHQDRLLPIAPEFAELLLKTPLNERTGRVFRPRGERQRGERLTTNRVTKTISMIGKEAGIVVNVEARSGKKKYASAHDYRRAYGDRWALRVMPPVLMQLMRHESIETTMRFYVGRSVQATADIVWDAYKRIREPPAKENTAERDTLRDTDQTKVNDPEPLPDES